MSGMADSLLFWKPPTPGRKRQFIGATPAPPRRLAWRVHRDGDVAIQLVCRQCERWRASITQSNWLQWLATLDVIGEHPTDLSHESPLIL